MSETDSTSPWAILEDWDIIGMNHYRDPEGCRRLFVAMVKGNHWIKEEGPDDHYLWTRLWHKAQAAEGITRR